MGTVTLFLRILALLSLVMVISCAESTLRYLPNRFDGIYIVESSSTSGRLHSRQARASGSGLCRNLTAEDAPENGGLVCHWYMKYLAQICVVRCNRGYVHFPGAPRYEDCSPGSEFQWSFKRRGELINPCIETISPVAEVDASASYQMALSPDDVKSRGEEIKQEFVKMLIEQGVCHYGGPGSCVPPEPTSKPPNLEEIKQKLREQGIILGRGPGASDEEVISNYFLGPRNSMCEKSGLKICDIQDLEIVDPGNSPDSNGMRDVSFHFKIKAVNFDSLNLRDIETDLPKICDIIHIPQRWCGIYGPSLLPGLLPRSAANRAKSELNKMFLENGELGRFSLGDRPFRPSGNIQLSDVKMECAEGMVHAIVDGEICSPCLPGTYFNVAERVCLPCSPGTYQPEYRQTSCKRCRSSTQAGATECYG